MLKSIMWIDSSVIDTSFFGTTIFYGDSGTFNDTRGVQYRIILKGTTKACFEDVISTSCKKQIKNGEICKKETDCSSGFCWRH